MSADGYEPLRLDFAFTPKDTPELRARVHRDLERVWREVRAADPAAATLALTGGFSRGEGSAVGARPLNDYDLVVFRRRLLPRAGPLYARLSATLEDAVGLHVDLHPVWERRVRHLAPKVFWFDVRFGGRVLAGDDDALARIPVAGPEAIPPEEAARLLANRAVGLLEALPGPARAPDARLALLQSAKAVLACAEAELVLAKRYHPSVRERLLRLHHLAKERHVPPALLDEAEWATAWKLDPEDAVAGRRDPGAAWAAARAAMLEAARTVLPRAGWGAFEDYPRDAPFDATDLAFAWRAAKPGASGRPRAAKPSHEARALGFRLLAASRWPEGPTVDDPEARRLLARLGAAPPEGWPETLRALLAIRRRTLH